jgi:hypothetical protein
MELLDMMRLLTQTKESVSTISTLTKEMEYLTDLEVTKAWVKTVTEVELIISLL